MLALRKLESGDAASLGSFFVKNNTDSVTSDFCPFSLSAETAASLLAPGSKDLFFLLEHDGNPVGFGMLRGFDEGYEIPSFGMFIDTDCQGKGFGFELVKRICDFASDSGISSVRLSVFEENHRAIHLYKKFGFHELTHARKNNRNSLIMKKDLEKEISVYASTACLPSRSEDFSEFINKMCHAGITEVEVSYFPGLTESALAACSSRVASLMLHAYVPFGDESIVFNLASPNLEARHESIDFAKKRIELSSRIGAEFYAVHAGFVHDPSGRDEFGFTFPEVQEGDLERAESIFYESITELTSFAQSHKVRVLLENNVMNRSNAGKLLLVSPADFARNRALFEMAGARILLDIGHAKVSRMTEGETWEISDFSDLSQFISGMHLHDNDGLADRHFPFNISPTNVEFIKGMTPHFVTLEGRYKAASHLSEQVRLLEELLNAD